MGSQPILFALMTAPASLPNVPAPPALAPWMPDRGDGTYRNPVLFADYSDPDAIRVGEDYWLTSSSFSHVPGLPILHSRDLVNWRIVNHALPRLVPEKHFSVPRHGAGVWAPSIRFHDGRFWIFYPDPDYGIYVITATDPAKRWTEPVLVKAGKGLIDPCPFWDIDGTGYLIHAWAKSRSGIKNRLTLHRLRDDNEAVMDAGTVIIDGDTMTGWETIEGPKLYRRGDYYYVFAPAGGVATGYQAVFRARSLYGPYESRIVLEQGSTDVNGPHQGAWVQTPGGADWFLHFQEVPAYGRLVHLQPMRWQDDWPLIGSDRGKPAGEPVAAAALPSGASGDRAAPATSDEFDGPDLGLQWQWQANPERDWASLCERPGWLRLRCVPQSPGETLWPAAHLLMQKFPAPQFQATTALAFSPQADGDTAGLVVFGHSYAWIGLRREQGRVELVFCRCADAHQHGAEFSVAARPVDSGTLHLRVTVTPRALCQFSVSPDGTTFSDVGDLFPARSSYWVGAKVGLFASARGAGDSAGHADFDWFRVQPLSS